MGTLGVARAIQGLEQRGLEQPVPMSVCVSKLLT